MTNKVKVSQAKLSELIPDDRNANNGTVRGQKALEDSIQEFGFVEAGTLDRHNRIIGGNKRTDAVAAVGLSDDAIIIDVDGTKPVYLRTPHDLDTPQGRKLAYALNRIHELSFDLDPLQFAFDLESGLDLSGLWSNKEATELLEAAGSEIDGAAQNGKEVSIPEQWMVLIECSTEQEQVETLERLAEMGYKCKALIS